MKVLSLFDGVSCGQLALQRAGVKVESYFASEIEKSAIEVTQRGFPKTTQLGDVTKVDGKTFGKADMIMGGSPCTGFSFAGKGLNFNDPQSKLFFEFVRLVDEIKPKYFFLENVKMKQEHQDVITKYLDVSPVLVNSGIVSAQGRNRLYWTNLSIDKLDLTTQNNVFVKDILEDDVDDKYKFSKDYTVKLLNQEVEKEKAEKIEENIYTVQGRTIELFSDENYCFPTMTPKRFNMRSENGRRFKPETDKFYTLTTQDLHGILNNKGVRLLSPREWERLQTFPDDWTAGFPDYKRYKMIGNAWTVDVISYLFGGLK